MKFNYSMSCIDIALQSKDIELIRTTLKHVSKSIIHKLLMQSITKGDDPMELTCLYISKVGRRNCRGAIALARSLSRDDIVEILELNNARYNKFSLYI